MKFHFLVIRTQSNMTIYDYDNDFAHYEADENFKWNFKEWRKYTKNELTAIERKKKRELEEKNAKNDTDWGDYFQ